MDKPLVIEIDETIGDLVSVVDAATQIRKIPCYLLEMILSDVLSQVQEVARREREIARQSLEKQIAEAKAAEANAKEAPSEANEENTEV